MIMHFLIEKMEKKFGKYAIPNLMKYVIACYVIGYVIQFLFSQAVSYLTLEPYMIFHFGQVWRLVSWVLIPPSRSNIIFVVIMLVLYYQLGTALERTWGTFRFNLYIFGGVIWTIIGALLYYFAVGVNTPVSIGWGISTYYINLTIFLAFAICYPDMQVMLYFLIPIKMKWMAIVYAAMVVYEFVISGAAGRVAIVAAAVNFLLFFLSTRNMMHLTPKQIKRRRDYQKNVRSANAQRGATIHRCAICGRTELDDPNLQFRYCSKCKGNHEYCQNHLFTHTHIQ